MKKSNTDKYNRQIQAYNNATNIINSELEWKIKFDLIFSDVIVDEFKGCFDYYDPDMDYEDDVMAYYNALTEYMETLTKIHNI